MKEKFVRFAKFILDDEVHKIPRENYEQFLNERLDENLRRERIFSYVLFFWNFAMSLYICLGAFNGTWAEYPAYEFEFWLHLVGVFVSALLLTLFRRKTIKKKLTASRHFIIFVLLWSILMTLIDLQISQQQTVFALAIATVSIAITISFKEFLLYLFMSYLLLIGGTLLTIDSYVVVEGVVLNSVMVVFIGAINNKIVYHFQVNNFLKSKIIEESQKELERALAERTRELSESNEKLLQEMNARHEMEIQVLKAEVDYQKSIAALNEALEYDKLRGEFFANVSHEIKAPLNVIFCSIQMLKMHIAKNDKSIDYEKVNKYTNSIRNNTYGVLRLVNNILDITKIESGYLSPVMSNNDIVALIENITTSVYSFAEFNSLELMFDTEIEEKIIACDPHMIDKIFMNLLSNAFKFTKPGGKIIVEIGQKDGYVVIKVKDNGVGIAQEEQETIFERFTRSKALSSKDIPGSGIGLSLVKAFVDMHKGSVRVESEPRKGSCFIIELPDIVLLGADGEKNNLPRVVDTEMVNIEFSEVS